MMRDFCECVLSKLDKLSNAKSTTKNEKEQYIKIKYYAHVHHYIYF